MTENGRGSSARVRLRVAVLVLHDSHILLVYDPSYRGGWWILPGGAVEFGEDVVDAAVREVREETGISTIIRGFWRFREIWEPDPDNLDGEIRRSLEVFVVGEPTEHAMRSPLKQPHARNVAACRWFPVSVVTEAGGPELLMPPELLSQLRSGNLDIRPLHEVALPALRIDPVTG